MLEAVFGRKGEERKLNQEIYFLDYNYLWKCVITED